MYERKISVIQEECWLAVTGLYEFQEDINKEIGNENNEGKRLKDYQIFCNFATRIAKACAKKILDNGFSVEDNDTLEKLWFDTTVEVSNEILKDVSLFGHSFQIIREDVGLKHCCLDLVSDNGRCFDYREVNFASHKAKEFIAEDLLRIATGLTLTKQKRKKKSDKIAEYAISFLADYIGNEISYKEIYNILEENNASDNVVNICNEIFKGIECDII